MNEYKREPGFYWVKRTKNNDWEIAYYSEIEPFSGWVILCWKYSEPDESLYEIDERKIIRDGL